MADINGDGSLGRHEFVVAMFLIESVLNGDPLPEELPDHIKSEHSYSQIPRNVDKIDIKSLAVGSAIQSGIINFDENLGEIFCLMFCLLLIRLSTDCSK